MGSIVNRRRVMSSEIKIPYDRVEYLESTGTQWIDTGIKFDTTKHGLFVDGIFINDLSGIRTIAGCWEGSFDINHLSCAIGGNYENCYFSLPILSGFRGGSAGKKIAEPGVRNMVGFINHGIENDVLKATLFVNGVETKVNVNNPYVGISAQTYPLGGVKYAGTNNIRELVHFLWYGFKFYEYDNLIMDLIPVRVGTTGYMYDKVSGKLFGNAGTGAFVLGPDVK